MGIEDKMFVFSLIRAQRVSIGTFAAIFFPLQSDLEFYKQKEHHELYAAEYLSLVLVIEPLKISTLALNMSIWTLFIARKRKIISTYV